MKTIEKLESEGYRLRTNLLLLSAERGRDDLLSGKQGFESIDDVNIEHPYVIERMNALINHLKKKEEHDKTIVEGGEWLVFESKNDIGWIFVEIGYFTYSPVSEMMKCLVRNPDGSETNLFLKEINTKGDKKYYDANETEFDGEILKRFFI